MSRQTSRFSFEQIPESFNPRLLPPVRDWKWVATFGYDTQKPCPHPQHRQWVRNKDNIHRPKHREVMLTLSGDTIFSLEGKVYRRRPGTIFLFDHEESRDFRPGPHQAAQSFSCLWLHLMSRHFFTFNTVRLTAGGVASRDLPNGRMKSGSTASLIMEAWDYCREEAPPSVRHIAWECLKAQISAVCLEILATSNPIPPPNHQQEVVEAIKKHVLSHPEENLNLQRLARLAGYSPFFFHRMFQQYTGRTPKQFVDEARLEKARDLIRDNHTIEHVAEALGFCSPSHFGAFFKKHMRLPPRRWAERQER